MALLVPSSERGRVVGEERVIKVRKPKQREREGGGGGGGGKGKGNRKHG